MKIVAGAIYWLPRHKATPYKRNSAYGHPVLVLNTWAQHDEAQVCIMTSFGNMNIDVRYPNTSHMRPRFLAIGNTPSFDGRHAIQTTDNSLFTDFQYVRIKRPLLVAKSILQPFKRMHTSTPVYIVEESWADVVYWYMRQNHPTLKDTPTFKELAQASTNTQSPYDGWVTSRKRGIRRKMETTAAVLSEMRVVGVPNSAAGKDRKKNIRMKTGAN